MYEWENPNVLGGLSKKYLTRCQILRSYDYTEFFKLFKIGSRIDIEPA